MDLPQTDDYPHLFLNDTPLLDVRAPVEYLQGAFSQAKNLPLINDDERQAIGLRYKTHGQDAAITLGHELVRDEIKEHRVAAWIEFIQQHPQGALYCFRGGLRSKISQQWIYEATGIQYPRVTGGYKALRRFLITALDEAANELSFIVLTGRTGIGKTRVVNQLHHKVDLEAIYQHRGSAFGKRIAPQPSQIDIENTLAVALLKLRDQPVTKILLEDEAPKIGPRRLPHSLIQATLRSPLLILEAEMDERVDIVFQEYIIEALAEYQTLRGESQGFDLWAENLQQALAAIQKRLGGQNYQKILPLMDDAILKHRNAAELQYHKAWIRALLVNYYDPMYDYQLAQKMDRVIFRGTHPEILSYLNQQQDLR